MLSIDGLASGLDTSGLIQQILELERRPIQLLQVQVQEERLRQSAYLDLSTALQGIQSLSDRLAGDDLFRGVQVDSSNEDALVASAEAGVPPGVYSFRVAQLARSSQFVSGGFATADSTPVGAGTLSLEVGGGFVDVDTELEELNGGAGVARGTFRITDAAGNSAVIDLSTAVTVDDVLTAINDSSVNVLATVAGSSNAQTGRGLVLEDLSGGGGTLTVEEIGGQQVATDLGLLGTAVAGTLEGTAIRTIGRDTLLASLRDGLGLDTQAGDDLIITAKDGTALNLDLDFYNTVGDLIDGLAAATGNPGVALAINAAADGFTLTDSSGGGGSLVISGNGTTAPESLGLASGSYAGTSVTGSRVVAGINDVLLSTLNGGSGVTLGSIDVQDRAGTSATVDLSSAETLQDVIRAINDAAPAVTASINSAGNGLALRDTSGGGGPLEVSESGGGSTAAELGILTGAVSDDSYTGTDLNPQYINANTRLDSLNGGRGVAEGSIRITDRNGVSFTVDLSQETDLGDVIRDINGAAGLAGSNVTARINDQGNGLLLESSSGSGTLRVDEVSSGTTARDLGISGVADAATPGVIDGSFEETITISATDTLEDVRSAIEALGIDVSVSIVNDGSSGSPFRLSVVAGTSGRDGRLLIGAEGGTSLDFTRTAEAQDGVVFFGESSGSSSSLLIRSNSNTYRDIVQGMTITAQEVSDSPVQIVVSRDSSSVTDDVAEMVNQINSLLEQVDILGDFDVEGETAGILLGDSALRNLKRSLLRGLTQPLSGVDNEYTLLSEVGIRLRSGRLEFNAAEFQAAVDNDLDAVKTLFGAARPLTDEVLLEDLNNGRGVSTDTAGNDFQITLRDGTQVEVDITGALTMEDVIDAINSAGGGSITASLSTTQNSLVLTDQTSGASTFRVTALNSSSAFADLGINASADVSGGGVITGDEIDLVRDVGVAARLSEAIEALVSPDSGLLTSRNDGLDTVIASLEDRIESIEDRVLRREELLRRQFADLEQIISSSQQTLERLTAQLGTLG